MSIIVEEAGWCSVQDLGRPGYGASGVPRSGAFDEWALRAGNRLCGNQENAAGLEVTLRGPSLRFDRDAAVAITGARFMRTLDDVEVPQGETFTVRAGQRLAFGPLHAGLRAYVCVSGGIQSPLLLGSRSASPRAGIGGMLAGGETLAVGPAQAHARRRQVHAPESLGDALVRIILGPQAQAFTPDAIERLAGEPFVVSTEADRVGLRLDGPVLTHSGEAGIEPEGVVAGCIQVPGDGRPIILGPDGPVTGGYAKIATVIGADLCILAQAKPGTTLRFEVVTPGQARDARAVREHALQNGIIDA